MIDKAVENKLESLLMESMQQLIDENFTGDVGSIFSVNKQNELEKCSQFMMVTISSFNFKCVVMLHFPNEPGFRNLISISQASALNPEASDVFLDKLGEMCNVLSGALKRKLEYTFSTIGLSTPQLLSQYSLGFFLDKKPDCNINLKVDVDNKYVLFSTILLFKSKNCEFELNSSLKNADYLDHGDLILF